MCVVARRKTATGSVVLTLCVVGRGAIVVDLYERRIFALENKRIVSVKSHFLPQGTVVTLLDGQ